MRRGVVVVGGGPPLLEPGEHGAERRPIVGPRGPALDHQREDPGRGRGGLGGRRRARQQAPGQYQLDQLVVVEALVRPTPGAVHLPQRHSVRPHVPRGRRRSAAGRDRLRRHPAYRQRRPVGADRLVVGREERRAQGEADRELGDGRARRGGDGDVTGSQIAVDDPARGQVVHRGGEVDGEAEPGGVVQGAAGDDEVLTEAEEVRPALDEQGRGSGDSAAGDADHGGDVRVLQQRRQGVGVAPELRPRALVGVGGQSPHEHRPVPRVPGRGGQLAEVDPSTAVHANVAHQADAGRRELDRELARLRPRRAVAATILLRLRVVVLASVTLAHADDDKHDCDDDEQ